LTFPEDAGSASVREAGKKEQVLDLSALEVRR